MNKNIDLKRAFITAATTTTASSSSYIKHILWYAYFLVRCRIVWISTYWCYWSESSGNSMDESIRVIRSLTATAAAATTAFTMHLLLLMHYKEWKSAHFKQVNWANLFATTNTHKHIQSHKHGICRVARRDASILACHTDTLWIIFE